MVLCYWMPDQACPQLDWGSGMTRRSQMLAFALRHSLQREEEELKFMKQNITLSIDRELIKRARVLAAHRRTSISLILSEELEKLVEDSKKYELAKKKALNYVEQGFHLGGGITASRGELHER